MNNKHFFGRSVLLFVWAAGTLTLSAAPSVSDVQVTSVVYGQPNVGFQVVASDPGGIKSITITLTKVDPPALTYALNPVTWYATTPYSTSINQLVNFPAPPIGNYKADVKVTNASNQDSIASRAAYVFAESRRLPAGTVTGTTMEVADGELVAPDAGSLTLANGSNVTYGSSARIVLKPGFTAASGSKFYALIAEVSGNGEIDSDGDGLGDATETLLGTNKNSVDTDGDGIMDYTEYLIGTSMTSSPELDPAPGGFGTTFQLVIQTPLSKYGVNTSSWSLTPL